VNGWTVLADVLHPGEQGSKPGLVSACAARVQNADVLHPGEQGSKPIGAGQGHVILGPTCCIQENKDRNRLAG